MSEPMMLAISFLWKGMLGIFAFMFLFYGIITGLDKIFDKNSFLNRTSVKIHGAFTGFCRIFGKNKKETHS